jgi:general secretion pathway protein A
MYEQHFGFKESPFSITPDPRFFYANSVYLEAYANLRYGIEAKKGFIAITGEVGTGKTTLLRKLMLSLDKTIQTVLVFNTDVTFNELLRVILRELGLPRAGKDRLGMIEELNDYLIEQLEHGQTVCLLMDEVQHLSDESLEGLRLLSNLETDRQKLLQIVLMGQPELQDKLDQPHLRQLKQRIAIRCEIARLRDDEVRSYINFRLRVAGRDDPDLFQADAIEEIALYSKGIPRLINVICDNALVIAFAGSRKSISRDVIGEVVHDLRLTSANQPTQNQTNQTATAAAILSIETTPQISKRKPITWLTAAVPASLGHQQKHTSAPLVPSGQNTSPNKPPAEIAAAPMQTAQINIGPKDHRVTIQHGSTVFQIANDAYGSRSAIMGMDLIAEFNPSISNLNWISAGEDLLLPALSEETLLRRQPDGSFRLIVASFLSRREAEEFAQQIVRDGFSVIVTAKAVSNNLVLHRLEITGLKNLEHARQTIQIGFKSRWAPFAPKPLIQTQANQEVTGY